MNQLTNYFKLLSDETRLRIVILLSYKALCVCELCGIMNESQPKISKHLAKLRDMGIIQDERQGQFIFYRLSTENTLYLNLLNEIINHKNEYPVILEDIKQVEDAEKYLENMKCSRGV